MGKPKAWAELLSGDVEYITVNGKHFYLTEDIAPVSFAIKSIGEKLQKGR